jgi:hypothetical protein
LIESCVAKGKAGNGLALRTDARAGSTCPLPDRASVRSSAMASSVPQDLGTNGLTRPGAVVTSGGISLHVLNHAAGPGTFHDQLWFRDSPASYCDAAAAFNLSNGVSIAW